MALSLAFPCHTELQTLLDPLRISLDHTFSDQMEFSSTPINNNLQNTSHTSNTVINNFQEYVIDFVDSPPNSKDSWPSDYPKPDTQGPTILDVQSIYALNTNRKRRMDWESLDINQGVTNSSPNDAKVPNLGSKERDKKKVTGRASWADDIDFDLNGEFGNNGYLNNEAFLSLSSALTVLKQEIPSPNNDVAQKRSKTPENSVNKLLLNENNIEKEKSPITGSNNNNNNNNNPNNSNNKNKNNNININNNKTDNPNTTESDSNHSIIDQNGIGGYQQLVQQGNIDNTNSARNSPTQSDVAKNDTPSNDFKFQYVLAAATSIATKSNEETLTYLNQGQSYEIKLKKLGDLSQYRGKILKSVIKICFHERRLQYMEREQMQQWQQSRPGERIIEIDVPLSYGLCHVSQSLNPMLLNTCEILWDPMKEVGVYIKVNCISTEFTPKKHGGEKGVPFRIQIETYLDNNNNNNNTNTNANANANNTTNNIINNNTNNNTNTNNDGLGKPIHAAACQIKVFKLKGADRKHKQDREKIQKRPLSEQEKFQPSYECTIFNEIPSDSISSQPGCYSPEYIKPTISPLMPNSPVHIPKYDGGIISFGSNNNNPSPIAINSVTSTNTNSFKLIDQNMVSPQQVEMEEYITTILKDSTPTQVSQWLTFHRLNSYVSTFTHFSGSDILRMSKEDLIQICGLADGIRMFNTLHAKAITPRLTIYISLDGSSYHAIYLISNTTKELTKKIIKLPGFLELCTNPSAMNGGTDGNVYPGWGMQSKYSGSGSNLYDASKLIIYINGPSGIHVMITDEVLNNIKDDSLFTLEVQNGKVLLKAIYKNENN